MVQKQYITKRQKGKHLTLSERGKIEAYWNMGFSKTEIALRIGVSRRTIQREIQRGWVSGLLTSELDTYDSYVAQTAQRKYEEKQNSKEGSLKIGKNHKLVKYLECSMLQEKKKKIKEKNREIHPKKRETKYRRKSRKYQRARRTWSY
ncbi:transposase [Fusobacterium necrophorum BL]|uniref:Transposase n=1 Tax=Fusobacterium necrophorum BL TaxID=1441732 RepID=A0AB73BUC0_9FUSO|nr:helix-turn-helix domain-containing protein [Fusobacterium necrophorum]KDE61585.1 transposase [Fusobacterium necrophorum BL]